MPDYSGDKNMLPLTNDVFKDIFLITKPGKKQFTFGNAQTVKVESKAKKKKIIIRSQDNNLRGMIEYKEFF